MEGMKVAASFKPRSDVRTPLVLSRLAFEA
jgi:hypothetical protein